MHALLFSDVVDSTALAARLGDEGAAALWAGHDRVARDLLQRHRGREIDRSDGLFLLFDEMADAARYALGYHAALAPLGLAVRVGLHHGSVALRRNPPDAVARGAKPLEVEGIAKPLAARVMALARGGQTLLSGAARQALPHVPATAAAQAGAVPDALPEGTELRCHGHYRLKGIEEPIEVFELGAAGIPFAAPADAEKAYRVVRVDDLWRPAREIRHNLAPEPNAFVGRHAELRELAARLEAGARLVSLLGPGGIGKTRLVRRFGLARLGDWPGGSYFCDLSEARTVDGICYAVAGALGVPLGTDDPIVRIGHLIAARGRCLLILDNFEQVVQHAEATLARWLDRAHEAAFVVTSRERLQLPAEQVLPVEPLPTGTDAIELFVARARARRAGFTLDAGDRAAVADVVRLLDGLPLAIELAAARIGVLSPQQLVARMKDRFVLLAGARGAAARQATLRAAIDWSWELLSPWEQAALAQCAVFESGFTMVAAEAVLDLSDWPQAPPAIDVVQALVDKSLLRAWVPFDQRRVDYAEPYFGMYLSIHEYATERLSHRTDPASMQAALRHGRHHAGSGTDDAIDSLGRAGGVKRRHELALDIDDLVVACRRAVARADTDTAVATLRAAWAVFDLKGSGAVAGELAEQVCAMGGMADPVRARALATRAWVCWRAGRVEQAVVDFEQALRLHEGCGERRAVARVLNTLGLLRHETGRLDEARACWDRALTLARDADDRSTEGSVQGNLGLDCWKRGRPNEAREHWEEAAARSHEEADVLGEGINVGNLAMLCDEQSRTDEALVLYERALALHREAGNRRFEGIVQVNLGCLHAESGDLARAQQNFGSALAIFREVGDRRGEGVAVGSHGQLALDQGQLGQAWNGLQAALVIHREVGNRAEEGSVLGHLGDVLHRQGRLGEAREMLQAGERLLRGLGHPLELARLLCERGRLDVACGDRSAATAALAEAVAAAETLELGAGSIVRREIASLRASLA